MTSSVTDALVGQVIDGRYRVLSHLADGGMASVYVAMDGRLDREVALKVMRPGLARDPAFVDRFRREARASARLSHPNVVAVFDQGEDDGRVFLVMELVDGKTLRNVIHDEAPLTVREALAILEPILDALRAAHSAGIIHRDVKPENVIIRRDGEVKVADFGLARAVTNHTATSQTGVVLGTVSYLSPEQVESGSASPRSDVYAAGLLLYEMLTGDKAVTGETPIQIAYKHVHGRIAPPSSLRPDVPAVIDDLVAGSTATDPDARFDSAGAFLEALTAARRTLAEGGPGSTPRAPTQTPVPPAAPPPVRDDEEPWATADPRPVDERTLVGPAAHSPTAALPIGALRRRRRWPWWIAALLLVLGGSTAGWWFVAGPGSMTTVPTVVSVALADAERSLDAQGLDATVTEAFSETVAKGVVISATPAAGSEVSKRSAVTLVVSKGPERYVVPALASTPADKAADLLAANSLTVGTTTEQWSETVEQGLVISQSPEPETSVKRDTPVNLVVSKGRQPITVPVVTGQPVAAAEKAITDAGLKSTRAADVNSDTVAAGRVVSQEPASGTLFRGGTVTITVSKGPVMVEVPRVLGSPINEAVATLERAGFKVQVRRPLGTFFELVRDQSVAPGQSAPKGSTIILTVV